MSIVVIFHSDDDRYEYRVTVPYDGTMTGSAVAAQAREQLPDGAEWHLHGFERVEVSA